MHNDGLRLTQIFGSRQARLRIGGIAASIWLVVSKTNRTSKNISYNNKDRVVCERDDARWDLWKALVDYREGHYDNLKVKTLLQRTARTRVRTK